MRTALGVALVAAAALHADEAPGGDDLWVLEQARAVMLRLGNERWSGDLAAALAGSPSIPATDDTVRELAPLLTEVSAREPRGIFANRPETGIPRPSWTLARQELDGDGQLEVVLAGGTGPAPFYAVFDRAGDGWRILHDAPFRFVGAASRGGRVHLIGVFDGYGVDGPRLAVDVVGGPKHRVVFNLLQWPTGAPATSSPISECATTRRTALRSAPVRDDRPTDRGMEDLAPGNVFQTLAAGSTGWVLHARRGDDGEEWSLCCFVGDVSPPLRAQALRRRALLSAESLLVGWVRTRDLTRR